MSKQKVQCTVCRWVDETDGTKCPNCGAESLIWLLFDAPLSIMAETPPEPAPKPPSAARRRKPLRVFDTIDRVTSRWARNLVESELHAAGIIEDPDTDGGLLG